MNSPIGSIFKMEDVICYAPGFWRLVKFMVSIAGFFGSIGALSGSYQIAIEGLSDNGNSFGAHMKLSNDQSVYAFNASVEVNYKLPAGSNLKASIRFKSTGSLDRLVPEAIHENEDSFQVVSDKIECPYYQKEQRLQEMRIFKSFITLDVTPSINNGDKLSEIESLIREIEIDGLVWKCGKLIPTEFGTNKLQIICSIENLKVSLLSLRVKILVKCLSRVQLVGYSL